MVCMMMDYGDDVIVVKMKHTKETRMIGQREKGFSGPLSLLYCGSLSRFLAFVFQAVICRSFFLPGGWGIFFELFR